MNFNTSIFSIYSNYSKVHIAAYKKISDSFWWLNKLVFITGNQKYNNFIVEEFCECFCENERKTSGRKLNLNINNTKKFEEINKNMWIKMAITKIPKNREPRAILIKRFNDSFNITLFPFYHFPGHYCTYTKTKLQ